MSAITRRNFVEAASLAGAGLAAMPAASALASEGLEETTDVWAIEDLPEPSEVIDADVCVLGAGGTGLAAAIQASQLGLKVVLLEKNAMTGGSFIGSEGLFALGSHWQEEAGVDATVSDVIKSVMDFHHWHPHYDLYKAFFDITGDTIQWLEDLGVEFDHVRSLGTSVVCWHVYKGSSTPGVEFMASMTAALEKTDVDLELETSGKKLIMEDGKVAGCLALRKDGSALQVNAPVVIVGTGGYANNPDVLGELSGIDPELTTPSGAAGRDADGIKMMHEVGADWADYPGTVMFYGPIPKGSLWGNLVVGLSLNPILWVNQDAQRFINEDMYLDNFAYVGIATKNQDQVFTIFNQKELDHFETVAPLSEIGVWFLPDQPVAGLTEAVNEFMEEFPENGFKADTVEELAEQCGLEPEALAATIERYNGFCETGVDEDFGKAAADLFPLNEGPYYAFRAVDAFFCTVGGVRVNPKTEVIGTDGGVICGLYAGGCDAGGLYGDTYDVGRCAGSQASWAINSGRLAAKNAARYLGVEVDE